MTQRDRWLIGVAAAVFALLAIGLMYSWRAKSQQRDEILRLGPIVQQVQSGGLARVADLPNGCTQLSLPASDKAAAVGGTIYALTDLSTVPPTRLVLFIKSTGRGFNFEGLLYASQPIEQTSAVRAKGVYVVGIGPASAFIGRQIGPNWYEAYFGED